MTDHPQLSAEYSRQLREPMTATAPQQRVWFALEYTGTWGAQAVVAGNNQLPSAVQAHLDAALGAVPHSRLVFIRQAGATTTRKRFFVAVSDDTTPRLYRFELDTYADLLHFDLSQIVNGAMPNAQVSSGLYLVCTNAARDRCCAQYGGQVYEALRAQVGDAAWQTTHIGGHRFAGTLVMLPSATYYGMLNVQDVPALVLAESNQELYPAHLRGRACYPLPAQAADAFLRRTFNDYRYTAFRLIHVDAHDGGRYTVVFEDSSGAHHDVVVVERMSDYSVLETSGDATLKPVKTFRVLAELEPDA